MPKVSVYQRLNPRRRSVLYLHAAGWTYAMIGKRLGISESVVRKDLQVVARTCIPGVNDGPEPARIIRIVYALGLLDAGVDPEEVPHWLVALEAKVAFLMSQTDPEGDTNPLADMAG